MLKADSIGNLDNRVLYERMNTKAYAVWHNEEKLSKVKGWRNFIEFINPDLKDLMTIKTIFKNYRELENAKFFKGENKFDQQSIEFLYDENLKEQKIDDDKVEIIKEILNYGKTNKVKSIK